ncbi:DUF6385 domain-containing protein [Sporomusa acidovorans]|uniref:DUF6385 domain-containing protein n=1 Tax=Sporomusa acidovorans (strain ATCC 49682 / DSM 3132 / Mol) TaxID=1123286 RepID=A0ABZ3JAE6_SPOA4|nr:DUF6385 domain-containing protein [Sporomusa acidovorans]OZC15156.1 hypothetical protein SPACI_50680 [Sporomusa acidovorans DSM 3132]SDF43686.1 hypothetical protein SAMN04488499_104910 [Sporomusa acidovorans]
MPSTYIKPPLIDAYITRHRTVAKTMKHSYLLVGRHLNSYYESIAVWDLSSLPYDLDIRSATANFFIAYNNSQCPNAIEAYPIISRWKSFSASLRHPPLTTRNPIATAAISNTTEQLSFGITALVKKWQNNEAANLGLLLRMSEPVSSDSSVSLFSGNYYDSYCWPFIEINYNSPDVVPCIYKPETINVSDIVRTAGDWSYTIPLDILLYNYSYTISNFGTNPALVRLQVSADGLYWLEQSALNILAPSKTVALAPDTITRYARVAFCSLNANQNTTLSICTQGRTTI